jgi:hypothetical protein
MNYEKELNSIIKKYDLDSDEQRKQAYAECVKYADAHYASTFEINPFLKEAAEILKQEHIVKDAIYSMTPFDNAEKVNLEYSKSNGPTMTANRSGLIYLSKLLLNLSKANMTGEHVHLRCDKRPMSGKTFPLTISFEDDAWFSKHVDSENDDNQKEEQLIVQRDMDPFFIVGVVFTRPGPPTFQIRPLIFYKVIHIEKYTDQKVWKKKLRETNSRLYIFTFLDDSNVTVRYALDLDDKEIFFLSQKDLGR